jgi:hypothetical protein
MLSAIPTGQFIGTNIEIFLLICGGCYLAWFRPRRIRHQVQSGEISEAEAQARLQKLKPMIGYFLLIFAASQIIVEIMQLSGTT